MESRLIIEALDMAIMASERACYSDALKHAEKAVKLLLTQVLIDERDQIRRELAASDLSSIRSAGL